MAVSVYSIYSTDKETPKDEHTKIRNEMISSKFVIYE